MDELEIVRILNDNNLQVIAAVVEHQAEQNKSLRAENGRLRAELEQHRFYAEYYYYIQLPQVHPENAGNDFLEKTKDFNEHPAWWEWPCLCRTCQDDGTR